MRMSKAVLTMSCSLTLSLCQKWRASGHVALIYLTKYVFAEWEMFSNIAYTPSISWRRRSQPKWVLFNFLISQFLACIRLILIKLLWHFCVCWWIFQSLDYAAVGQEGIHRDDANNCKGFRSWLTGSLTVGASFCAWH